MKKIISLFLFVLIASTAFPQSMTILQSQKTKAQIISDNENGITFINSLEGFEISTVKTKDGNYSRIIVPNYYPDMQIGFPELPVMTKLIEVPLDAEFEINIISYDEQVVDLYEYGFNLPIVPNQASLFKNQSIDEVPFEKNNSIYRDKEFYATQPVDVRLVSKMRGVQVAQITVNPFSYDIESNTLTIKNNIVAEITYKNVDLQKSAQLKADKYSPAFVTSYKSLWNYKAPATKDAISQYPINYVIISDRMFEEALQPFIDWKTKKGFYVTVAYTDVIGNTTTAIKTYIQSLYEAGTAESHAPTYLLLVGDVAQIPA
ncbi:MAG: C25 family cysteine peptidase, partial [Bacteroidales bacterium]|nr:C25 family cysteine peptidase [Bacteroidales bacterium]